MNGVNAAHPAIARWTRRAIVGAIGLLLTYLVLANLAIRGGGLQRAIAGAAGYDLSIESAYSPFPGRLVVRGVELRTTVGLLVVVRSAELDVTLDIMALFAGRIELGHVRAERVSVMVRSRSADEGPSDSFALVALTQDLHAAARYTGVTVTSVEADIEEIHVFDLAYRGSARASGSFEVEPERFHTEALRIAFAGGVLERGEGGPTVDRVHGTATARGDFGDDAVVPWTLHVDATARVVRLDGLAQIVAAKGIEVTGGRGTAGVDLEISEGVLLPGGQADYETDEIAITRDDVRASGSATARLEVSDDSISTKLVVSDAELRRSSMPDVPPARVDRVAVALSRPRSAAHGAWSAAIDPTVLRVDDARWLGAVGEAIGIERGAIELRLSGELGATDSLDMMAEVPRAALRFRDALVEGDLSARARIASPDLASGAATLSDVDIRLTEARVKSPAGETENWAMQLISDRLEVHAGPGPGRVRGGFAADLSDTAPVVKLLERHRRIPKWATRLFLLRDLHVVGRLDFDGVAADVAIDRAASGTFDGVGRWRRTAEGARAVFLLRFGARSFGLELAHDGPRLRVFGVKPWFAKRRAAFPAFAFE